MALLGFNGITGIQIKSQKSWATNTFFSWIDQAKKDTEETDLDWLLTIYRGRYKHLAIIDHGAFCDLYRFLPPSEEITIFTNSQLKGKGLNSRYRDLWSTKAITEKRKLARSFNTTYAIIGAISTDEYFVLFDFDLFLQITRNRWISQKKGGKS